MLKVIRVNGKGRGVITLDPILRGQLVESCPVIVMPESDILTGSILDSVVYLWHLGSPSTVAVCLGMGSLYNHSDTPNIDYTCELSCDEIRFYTLRDIQAGEELTHNYQNWEFN
jgi:hypothetical protein